MMEGPDRREDKHQAPPGSGALSGSPPAETLSCPTFNNKKSNRKKRDDDDDAEEASTPPVPHKAAAMPAPVVGSLNYVSFLGEYGDVDNGPGTAGDRSRGYVRMPAMTSSQARRVIGASPQRPRVPIGSQQNTWRDWTPPMWPPRSRTVGDNNEQKKKKKKKKEKAKDGDEEEEEEEEEEENEANDAAFPRRSLDWSQVQRARLAGAAKAGAPPTEKTRQKQSDIDALTKGGQGKTAKQDNDESESEDESDSGSDSDIEANNPRKPLIDGDKKRKKSKKSRKSRKKTKSKQNVKVSFKRRSQYGRPGDDHLDLEDKRNYDNLPIYLEREREVIPLKSPLTQVMGFIGWQILTFVLGLSLGIFLSGILPGYDIADVGIHSHWWKNEMKKPPFQPPDEMLAPMWLISFTLAAAGMWFVWRRGGWKWNKLATALYLIHLFVFHVWLCIFFFLHELITSLILSFVGWIVMLVCLIAFYKRSRTATLLLAFTFSWKCFIVVDSIALWWLNVSQITVDTQGL